MLSQILQPGGVCTSQITPDTFLKHSRGLFKGLWNHDKTRPSIQLVHSNTLIHAQRKGTNVLQTPTYWTITIGLLNRYSGIKDFPAHIANFQHNSPKELSWCPFRHTTLGPIDIWVDEEGASYCCLLVCRWTSLGNDMVHQHGHQSGILGTELPWKLPIWTD